MTESPSARASGKDLRIETLRAFAILLVVGSHVIHDAAVEPARGMYDYINDALLNIRIPLFTVISGYLYGQRRVFAGRIRGFLWGKTRRILLPLLVVTSLEFLASCFLPGVNQPETLANLWRALIFPYEHFWFLQAIFLIFVLMAALDGFGWLRRDAAAAGLFGISLVWYLVEPRLGVEIDVFSFGAVSLLLPFFVLGYVTTSRDFFSSRWLATPILLAVLLAGLALQQLDWFLDLPYASTPRSVVSLMIGVSGTALLLRHRKALPGFAWLGSFAYAIYLYQGFGASVGRRIAHLLPFDSPHFYLLLVIGIAASAGVVVELVMTRVPVLRTLLLGKR